MSRRTESGMLRRADGATAVEYATVLPVLLLMLMGIIEYNTIMYALSVLDGSITAAAREGSTGYVNDNSTGQCPSPVVSGVVTPQSQATFIGCFVGLRTAGLLDTSKLQLSWVDKGTSTFSSSGDTPTFSPCTNTPANVTPSLPLCSESSQNAGDIVVYTVTYPWPIFTPILAPFFGNQGTVNLQASAVVKNEPYNVGSSR